MLSKEGAIKSVFDKHGDECLYITNTGFLSRDIYDLYPKKKNIFYMQGSMGLSTSIGVGLAMNTDKNVVVFVGDGSLLMHLGITHTIRDLNLENLFVYVIDNGCHESVGAYPCSPLESKYPGIDNIFKVKNSEKKSRVGISPEQNVKNFRESINGKTIT